MTREENIKQLQNENEALKKEVEHLKNEIIRLVNRNLALSERLEEDIELRRRTEVAVDILNGNIERQRNADLQDDAQLMALIELKVEAERPHLKPDFNAAALARLLGVSQERLNRLFVAHAPRKTAVEHSGHRRRVGHRQCAYPAAESAGGGGHDTG